MLPRSGRSCGTQGCTSRYAVGALQQHIYKWGADCGKVLILCGYGNPPEFCL